MNIRGLLAPAVTSLLVAAGSPAWAGTVNLWGNAAGDSAYYEYFSDSFFRLDLVEPSTNQQRFHLISDPATTVGGESFDGFPNDGNLRLGSVSYDESTLVGGTGTATITGLTLGVGADPADSSYVNFGRWSPLPTTVDSFSGTVTLQDGQPVAMSLTSSVHVVVLSAYTASGYFNVSGDQFELYLFGGQTFPTAWDYSGTLTTVPEPASIALLGLGALMIRRTRRS